MLENKTNKNPFALVQEESLFTLKHQKLLNTGREGECMCGCGLTCFHFAPRKKKNIYLRPHSHLHTHIRKIVPTTNWAGWRQAAGMLLPVGKASQKSVGKMFAFEKCFVFEIIHQRVCLVHTRWMLVVVCVCEGTLSHHHLFFSLQVLCSWMTLFFLAVSGVGKNEGEGWA